MIYMVECGFAEPDREKAWNEWYSGHLVDFLKVPEFHSAQRFIAVEPSFPKYRAMYTIESEAAFESPVYKGFRGGKFPVEWRSAITDFHRNLFDGNGLAPDLSLQDCLLVADEPSSLRVEDVDLQIWNAVGLDKSVSRRGIAVVSRDKGIALAAQKLPGVSVYTPVTTQKRRL